jgi:hypothetical protein
MKKGQRGFWGVAYAPFDYIGDFLRGTRGIMLDMYRVPGALLCMGSPEEVEAYYKKLIDGAGKGGGCILDGIIGIPDEGKPENLRAMVDTTREYGVYR